MARIRSLHPCQWTDEDFVELSMTGRILSIALRNFSDDKGIFEWKPKTIKMKVFPSDNVNIDAELDALLMQDQCIKFILNGKPFGALKNFCKYQRPKKPNNIHPISKEVAEYVEFKGEITSETEPINEHQIGKQFPTGGKIASQRKEEGGSKRSTAYSCPFSEFWAIWPNKVSKASAEKAWKKLSAPDKEIAFSKVENWFGNWRRENPHASPIHASTYLNQARFNDEQSPALKPIHGGNHEPINSASRISKIIEIAARGTSEKDWG